MSDLKQISQISIYLKEESERVNEVALLHPLLRTSQFNEESKPIATRKWRYTATIPLSRRITLKLQSFLFKHFSSFIPAERLTPEAKFKTVLAIILAQEEIREYFLSDPKKRGNFLKALQEAAYSCHYTDFSSEIPPDETPLKISQLLTRLDGKNSSLIDDLVELNLQMAALKSHERSDILYRILNQIERSPITSVIEVMSQDDIQSVLLTTKYAKYKITDYDKQTGKISYLFEEDRATCSIRTLNNSLPDAKGAINQRVVFDAETKKWVGSCCGELSTPFHILEQILFLTEQTSKEAYIHDSIKEGAQAQRKKIIFTSLFSWDEIGLITDQRSAIQKWDQKILKCNEEHFLLDLLHFNIPFNAFNKYPSPGEIKAKLQDINDETLCLLTAEAWEKLGLKSEALTEIENHLLPFRGVGEKSFLEKEKAILNAVDAFRNVKNSLINQLQSLSPIPITIALTALLSETKPNGKALKGFDLLLYFDYLAGYLGYLHNKNCQNATDRSAGADAADKAQYTFQKIYNNLYLPGTDREEEKSLFKVLYSMYLVWEEPEINTALSTGFTGEKFYNNFLQRNPETTRYLLRWLKKHPEIYLGLSDYRT